MPSIVTTILLQNAVTRSRAISALRARAAVIRGENDEGQCNLIHVDLNPCSESSSRARKKIKPRDLAWREADKKSERRSEKKKEREKEKKTKNKNERKLKFHFVFFLLSLLSLPLTYLTESEASFRILIAL